MWNSEDRIYYQQRAETELRLARAAAHPAARRAHYEIAGHYLDRACNGRPAARPILRIVTSR